MNDLPKLYFTMETYLFPLLEEELCELTAKMKEFLRIVEMIKPSRFITSTLRWSGLGRPMKDREKMLRAFFLKAVYDFPTTKGLIENLKTNPSLRRLCGWEYRGEVPSEATFSRAFGIFSREKVCNAIHAAVVRENYTDKLVGHASLDSTAIIGREKACRKNKPKLKLKKKRGRKSIAEKAAFPNRKSQKSKPGGLNCKCIKHYRRILPISRKVATGAVNATAKVKRPIGAATNSILRLGTGKFH